MSTISGGAASQLRNNAGKSAFGAFADNAFANFFNGVGSVVNSAKDWALSNQERVRQQVLERTKNLDPEITLDKVVSRAKQLSSEVYDAGKSKVDDVVSVFDNSNGLSSTYSEVQPLVNSGQTVNYLNADLAKHYGMDANSAYGEALQNTAYQRAVADLKAAGLNPVLAAGNVSPAGSYVTGSTLSGGSGAGASGAGGYGSSGKLLSGDAYNLLGTVGTVVGAVAGYAYSPAPWKLMGASTGAALGKGLLQAFAQGAGSASSLVGK